MLTHILLINCLLQYSLYLAWLSNNSACKVKYHPNATGKAKIIYDEIIKKLNLGVSVMDIHRDTDLSRDTICRIKRDWEGRK